jgi:hypothetical protein
MRDFEPQAAQVEAHQAYLDALDLLQEAEDAADRGAIRLAEAAVERTKREWHRLVRLAEGASRQRSG